MTSRNRWFAASLLVLPLLLLSACGGSSSTPVTLTGVSVSPTSASLTVGATRQLTVTGTYSDGSTAPVTASATFSSSAPAVASVGTGGLITALTVGTATVTSTYSGKSATTAVTVSAVAPTLSSIAISPDPASVAAGSTLQLTVTGTYSDSTTQNLTSTSTFVSGTPSVATVTSPGGLVTGLLAGTATITATNGGKTATRDVTVTGVVPPPGANQIVFYDGNGANVSFRDFGGAANNVTIDPTETFNGRKVVNFQVTSTGGYSGGAWYTSAPRDLSAYNALTFWAKASVAGTLNVAGYGNDAGANSGTAFPTERLVIPVTTAWQKFTIPVPDPARFLDVGGLFHLADAPDGYTLYLADIIYEHLGTGTLGTGAASINMASVSPTIAVAGTFTVDPAQSQVTYAVVGDPEGTVTVKPVANGFFAFASSNTAVATVNAAGVITGVAGGTASVTATLGGAAVAGSIAVTVAAIPAPGTLPPAAAPPSGSNVISLYSSQAGGFTGSTVVDKSGNVDTWLTCWSQDNNPTAGGDPFAITVGGTTANPRKYTLTSGGGSYAGVEFLGKTGATQPGSCGGTITGANTIDVSAMTHFHIDVWTPNANNIQVKLVDAGPTGDMSSGVTDGNTTLNGLNPPTYPAFGTGTWLSYDIPLTISGSSFQNGNWVGGAANLKHLGQMVFTVPNGGIIYVDNIYFYKAGGGGGAAPTTAPAAPSALPSNVMSLFSSTYTGGAAGGDYSSHVDSYNATCFGSSPSVAPVADYTIAGTSHVVKAYTPTAAGFLGIIELIGAATGTAISPDSAICNGGTQSGASTVDVSGMTGIHLDVWSPAGSTNFQVRLAGADASGTIPGPGQVGSPAAAQEMGTGAMTVAAGTWVPMDITFASMGPALPSSAFNKLALVKFFSSDAGTFYIDNVYFYRPPPPPPVPDFANITYDAAGTTYEFGGFGGASGSLVVDPDPAAPTNHVAKLVKPAGAQTWAGVSLGVNGLNAFSAGKIPFSATSTTMTVRAYSPAVGLPVLLKVENSGNGGISAEIQAITTVANAWETLSFTLPGVNLANTYDKVSLFPHFNTSPGADETFYFDDITFVP
jgi:uncharacterized protein YjdB